MDKRVLLAHGSGGKLSHELIEKYILPPLANPTLEKMDDSALVDLKGRVAFTTDSFVVNPLFFPGGDIGKLAVCGTINDLAMVGAHPLYLSLALIIEEGLLFDDLEAIVNSIRKATLETGVKIITGDCKVVNRGCADKLFVNTSGIGKVPEGVDISGSNAQPGDIVIINGPIGDHGIAVLAQRQGLGLKVPVESDCAPLSSLVEDILKYSGDIHSLRDPTRGGLATTLNELAQQSGVSIRVFEEQIPIRESVSTACSMLGLDPLYVANEGKVVVIASPEHSAEILSLMRKNPYGSQSAVVGEVREGHPGRVVMKTRLGASRIIDMLSGELLPRIC